MDTPDTLLICTAPFILITMSCRAQPALPGAQAHSQHGGRPLGSPGAGRAGEGTQRVSTGLWGVMGAPNLRLTSREAELLCPALSHALAPGSLMDICPCGQSSLKAGRWSGWSMVWCLGQLLALLTASSSPEEVPSGWGQRRCPEPALGDKGHLSTTARKNQTGNKHFD